MTDYNLYNKLAELNSRMTPERLLHEKGTGAYGSFQLYMPFADYTKAAFLNNMETETEVFVRFSRALGRRGSPETARDVRGMSVKFFTEQGEYDLLTQSLPVFFTNEAKKFPSLYKALRPSNGLTYDKQRFWSFMAENPETFHLILWLFSNRGTIKSYRHMEGYSVNTYAWRNRADELFFVRYRFIPMSGIKTISAQEAEFLSGYEPDTLSHDLYQAIEEENFPKYELTVQLIPEKSRYDLHFDIFDKTLIWPERICPYVRVGILKLDRLPSSYYDEVELAYLSPSHTVEGIEIPEDEMLELMCFAHDDGYRNRRR